MNGSNGQVVEINPAGRTAASKTLVPNGAGDLFGVATLLSGHGFYFVDDNGSGPAANSLQILH